MTRHIVTSTYFDLDSFRDRRNQDQGPGHVTYLLSDALDAVVHQPSSEAAPIWARLAAFVVGTPAHWSLARSVIGSVKQGDLIYATGSDCGLPVALLNALLRRRAKVAVYFVAPARVRSRALSGILARLPGDFMAVTGTKQKVSLLNSRIGSRIHGVHFADEQTDTEFFSPAKRREPRHKPLVVSCGLEQRDYRTLVAAVSGLDVDTKICAASPNFTAKTTVAMPEEMPATVEMRLFEFPDLRTLYRQADVTVVSLLPNDYSAGLTTLLEAIACGSPVIVTKTPGLASDFADDDLVIGVEPLDPEGLQQAIEHVLAHPAEASERSVRARCAVLSAHTSEIYVEALVAALKRFEAGQITG